MPLWSDSHLGSQGRNSFNRSTNLSRKIGSRSGIGSYAKQQTRVNYVADGSGRDTYIVTNHGGTCLKY